MATKWMLHVFVGSKLGITKKFLFLFHKLSYTVASVTGFYHLCVESHTVCLDWRASTHIQTAHASTHETT